MNGYLVLMFLLFFILAIRTQRDPMSRRHLYTVFLPISYLSIIVLGALTSLMTDHNIHVRDTGFIISLFVLIAILTGISSIRQLRKDEKTYGKIVG